MELYILKDNRRDCVECVCVVHVLIKKKTRHIGCTTVEGLFWVSLIRFPWQCRPQYYQCDLLQVMDSIYPAQHTHVTPIKFQIIHMQNTKTCKFLSWDQRRKMKEFLKIVLKVPNKSSVLHKIQFFFPPSVSCFIAASCNWGNICFNKHNLWNHSYYSRNPVTTTFLSRVEVEENSRSLDRLDFRHHKVVFQKNS